MQKTAINPERLRRGGKKRLHIVSDTGRIDTESGRIDLGPYPDQDGTRLFGAKLVV